MRRRIFQIRQFLASLAAAALMLAVSMAGAKAAIVTYSFTGTVTSGDFTGEHLAGTFSYDTATPGSGHYPNAGSFNFTIGPLSGRTAAIGAIDIIDEVLSSSDRLSLGGPLPPGGVFPTGSALLMELTDSTRTAFTSNALTDTLPPASAFDDTDFFFREFISGIEIYHSGGTIDSLTRVTDPQTSVPEPSALLLLAGACAALLWRRRAAARCGAALLNLSSIRIAAR
jgi:hypothetical protein